MITRRGVLHAVAGISALCLASAPALADWKDSYKELVLAAVPDENATGVERRYEPFRQHLEKQLGVPVKLRIANDYAAVIEGLHDCRNAWASDSKATPRSVSVDGAGSQLAAARRLATMRS